MLTNHESTYDSYITHFTLERRKFCVRSYGRIVWATQFKQWLLAGGRKLVDTYVQSTVYTIRTPTSLVLPTNLFCRSRPPARPCTAPLLRCTYALARSIYSSCPVSTDTVRDDDGRSGISFALSSSSSKRPPKESVHTRAHHLYILHNKRTTRYCPV